MTKKLLIIALLSVAVIAVVVTVCLVVFKEDEVLAPDYAPPAIEENAEKIEGDNEEKMEVSGDGSGAIGISYKKNCNHRPFGRKDRCVLQQSQSFSQQCTSSDRCERRGRCSVRYH